MAADAIIQGIEERRRIVVTPKWVRPMIGAKTVLQRLAERRALPMMAEADAATREEIAAHGSATFEATGAGGRAFLDADRERSSSAS